MRNISRRQIGKIIVNGKSQARKMDQLKRMSGIDDEVIIRAAISTCREHGELIFDDDEGGFYRPEDGAEVLEYKKRHPEMLKSMLAFRQRSKFGFNSY